MKGSFEPKSNIDTLGGELKDWKALLQKVPWYALVLAASPHLKSMTSIEIGTVQFDWLFYGLSIVMVLLKPQCLFEAKTIRTILFALTSLLVAWFMGVTLSHRAVLDLIALWVLYSSSKLIIKGTSPELIFMCYVLFSALVALFGVLEMLMGWNWSYGLDGLSYEPSHYAVVAAPAVIFVVIGGGVPKFIRAILPLSIFLTFSTTGIILMLALALFLGRAHKALSIMILILGTTFWFQSPDLRERAYERVVSSSVAGDDYFQFGKNRTTASILSNWHVAKASFRDFFPFGVGFSNHYEGYHKTFKTSSFANSPFFGTNERSGHSLGIRWLSEFGFFGLIILFYNALRIRLIWWNLSSLHRLVLASSLGHLFCKVMKLGSYFDYGTPMFVCIIFSLVFWQENLSNEKGT